jgi:type IV secretion system protein VirD4
MGLLQISAPKDLVTVPSNVARYLEDEQLFSEFLAFLAQDSRVLASVLSSARACLELWSDQEICRLTASNNVQLQGLRKTPSVFYLIVPEHRIRYFSLILNLFYSACFAYCLEHTEGLPVFFLLDEFGNLGRINEFAGIITTLRKRRCSVALILQELSQLTSIYGQHDGRTIYAGGCANKLFYSGLDLEATRYVEGMLGHSTEYDTLFGGIDDHARTVSVPLMRSDSVRMMRGSEGVLISGRRQPVKIKGLDHCPQY